MYKLTLFVLLSFGCIANDDLPFHSATLDDTKLIYWVDHETKAAVLYSRFEMFHKLTNFVSTTILTAKTKVQKTESYCSYDKLVFVDGNKEVISTFHVKPESIVFNNTDFTVSERELSYFVVHNQNRIKNGDGLRSKALKLNINNYSEKCI